MKFWRLISTVAVLVMPNITNAALIVHWDLHELTSEVRPDEQVIMYATIFNDISSDEIFTQSDIYGRYFPSGSLVGNSAIDGSVNPYTYTPSVINDLSMFDGMILNPGESFDFIFATLVPNNGLVEPGTYSASPLLSVRAPDSDPNSQFVMTSLIGSNSIYQVTVSAVPVPAAVWLFGSGLIGLVGVARRKKA